MLRISSFSPYEVKTSEKLFGGAVSTGAGTLNLHGGVTISYSADTDHEDDSQTVTYHTTESTDPSNKKAIV